MAGVLLRESHTELAQYPSIETLAIRFIPQIGCLVVLDKAANGLMPPPGTAPIDVASQQLVRAESADSSHWSAKSAMIPGDFEFQFESAAEVHFKSPRMHELDKARVTLAVSPRRVYTPPPSPSVNSTLVTFRLRSPTLSRALCGS